MVSAPDGIEQRSRSGSLTGIRTRTQAGTLSASMLPRRRLPNASAPKPILPPARKSCARSKNALAERVQAQAPGTRPHLEFVSGPFHRQRFRAEISLISTRHGPPRSAGSPTISLAETANGLCTPTTSIERVREQASLDCRKQDPASGKSHRLQGWLVSLAVVVRRAGSRVDLCHRERHHQSQSGRGTAKDAAPRTRLRFAAGHHGGDDRIDCSRIQAAIGRHGIERECRFAVAEKTESKLPERSSSLDQIVKSGHQLSEVIDSVRAMFGRDSADTTLVNVRLLVTEVLAVAQGELETHRIVLHNQMSDELPEVMAAPVQLQQVILNLIMNAIEAMTSVKGRERRLTIASGVEPQASVTITVSDSGVGICSTPLTSSASLSRSLPPNATVWGWASLSADPSSKRAWRQALGISTKPVRNVLQSHPADRRHCSIAEVGLCRGRQRSKLSSREQRFRATLFSPRNRAAIPPPATRSLSAQSAKCPLSSTRSWMSIRVSALAALAVRRRLDRSRRADRIGRALRAEQNSGRSPAAAAICRS